MPRLPLLLIAGAATLLPAAVAAEPFEGPRAALLAGLDRTDITTRAGAENGAYYGGQIGYDLRAGGLTFGVEADLGGSTARSSIGALRTEQGLFASAAGRIGLPLGERLLPFLRAGYAYHEVSRSSGGDFHGSGYTVGGGAELALTHRLFLRGEYRFSDYGSELRGQHFLGGIGLRF